MKKKIIIQIVGFFVLGMAVISCSDKTEDSGNTVNLADGVPVKVDLGTRALPNNLECDLYIYRKSSSDTDYILKEIVPFGNEDNKVLKFLNNELAANTYRFFFVATTPGNGELLLKNPSDADISIGHSWTDLRIKATTQDLSDDYYYGIITKTGNQILTEGTINAVLSRLIGQMTVDIYRVANNNVNNPINKVSPTVRSVLDRVKEINIKYDGLTQAVAFNAAGEVVEAGEWPDAFEYAINPVLDDSLRVNIPQENIGLIRSGRATIGSARIKGVCALPAKEKIRMQVTFNYYDTTPNCGNSHTGNHDSSCFVERTLTLNMPRTDNDPDELLSILSNTFTVNNAAIRFDRIIDVGVDGLVSFNVVWNMDN